MVQNTEYNNRLSLLSEDRSDWATYWINFVDKFKDQIDFKTSLSMQDRYNPILQEYNAKLNLGSIEFEIAEDKLEFMLTYG